LEKATTTAYRKMQLLEVKLQQLFEVKLHHCQKQSYKKLLPDKVKEKPVV